MAKKDKRELTNQEKLFAQHYLINLDAREAALRAGYSNAIAKTKAYQWVVKDSNNFKPVLYDFITKKIQKREDRLDKTGEDTIRELANLAFSNLASLLELKHEGVIDISDLSQLSPEQQRCIESISKTKDGFKIKFYDKVKPLELLAKHFGKLSEKIDINSQVKHQIIITDLTQLSNEQLLEYMKLIEG